MLYKHIPKRSELIAFRTRLAKAATLPLQVIELIRILRHARPMTVLRTAISALGAVQEQKADRAACRCAGTAYRPAAGHHGHAPRFPIRVGSAGYLRAKRIPAFANEDPRARRSAA